MPDENIDNEPLDVIAKKIEQCVSSADDKILEAAELVRKARARVSKEYAGKVKWYDWAAKNIKVSEFSLAGASANFCGR